MSTIKILGIDPAFRNLGLSLATYDLLTADCFVQRVSLVQTEKSKDGKVVRKSSDDMSCANALTAGLAAFVREFQPNIAVAEIPTGTQNARGSFSNGVCCGVLSVLQLLDLPLIEVSPSEVKMASVGSKTASKAEMIEWATSRWPDAGWIKRKFKGQMVLTADNEHMADACAAIAAGLRTAQFNQATSLMRAGLRRSEAVPA